MKYFSNKIDYLPINLRGVFSVILIWSSIQLQAQVESWLTTYDATSSAQIALPYASGDFLLVGSIDQSSFIAKRSHGGHEIWNKKLPISAYPQISHATISTRDTVILYRKNGEILKIDPDYREIVSIKTLNPKSFELFEYSSYLGINKIDNFLSIYGRGKVGSIRGNFYLIFDPKKEEVVFEKFEEAPDVQRHIKTTSLQNYIEVQAADDVLTITYRDTSDVVHWAYSDTNGQIQISDVQIGLHEEIFLCGSKRKDDLGNGEVYKFSKEGQLLWRTSLYPQYDPGWPVSFIKLVNLVQLADESIIVSGSVGQGVFLQFSNLFVSRLGLEDGAVQWTHTRHIAGDGESSTSMYAKDDYLIIAGIAGVTDYPEPAQAFVLKLIHLLSETSQIESKQLAFHPNPANDQLFINDFNQVKGNDFNIIDEKGRTMKRGVLRNPISIEFLPTGLYFLTIENGKQKITHRFVKN